VVSGESSGLTSGDERPLNVRLLAVADEVSPVIYSHNFPGNLPPFDLVLGAGDLPGQTLEFIATKVRVPVAFVLGNHAEGYVSGPDAEPQPPGGCLDAHLRLLEIGGLSVLGVEGSARYRDGPHQYSERQFARMLARLAPRLWARKRRYGRGVDVLLTHAPPVGPTAGDDHAHRGVPAFNDFHRRWLPRAHVHGHVHLSGSSAERLHTTAEGVRVVNAFQFTLIDL